MTLEYALWQKAAEISCRNYGWCQKMRDTQKSDWGVMMKNCDETCCDDFEKCNIRRGAYNFVRGATWMMHRVKPVIYGKVIKDLVLNESPYQDGPEFFEEYLIG